MYAPKSEVLSVYYAIFYSHMIWFSVWSLTTKSKLDVKLIYYKRSQLELLIFLTITLFAGNGLLKLDDVITCPKLKSPFDIKNNALPYDLNDLLKYCHDVNSHRTRTVSKE